MTETTTRTAAAPIHVVQVVSDGHEYLAECSCGWASEWHLTAVEADAAGIDHCDGSALVDEMDVLMSGLLDLQDDIAAVVVWLAENWSVALPPLGWSANGDDRHPGQAALRVHGYVSPTEFAAAAGVLGAVPVDSPPSESGAGRYRHATREFGRVQIEVFTSLADALAGEAAP
jgi:hypothetical protein